MKKITSVLLTIVFVTLAGCNTAKNSSPQTNQTDSDSVETSNDGLFRGTYLDLLSRGDSVQCTWTSGTGDDQVSGVTYVSGQKMRSETTLKNPQDGTEMMAFGIVDSEYVYSWTTATNMGTKMKLDTVNDVVEDADSDPDIDTESEVEGMDEFVTDTDFKCEPWNVDASKLVPPTDITFTDYSQIMETLNSGSGAPAFDLNNLCAMCEQIPDASGKAECLANCQ